MGESLGRAASAVADLVEDHARLAVAEIKKDTRGLWADIVLLLLPAPLVLAGHLILCVAAVSALSERLGWTGSATLVGVLNLVGGVLVGMVAVRRLGGRTWLANTRRQIRQSKEMIVAGLNEALSRPPPYSG